MIRFRIGTSVFQFRRSAVILGAVRVAVLLGLAYILFRGIYSNFPKRTITIPRTEVDKGELSVLEQRLEKLEEELQRNRIMLGQVKDTVKDLIKVGPDSEIKKHLLNGPLSVKVNRSFVALSSVDCHLCMDPLADADENMLDIYEKIQFDNQDGGVWKQGWNIEYDESQWNPHQKLKIFVVPHSHNDPGWIKTFEKYFKDQTQHILNNMVVKLKDDTKRKFIWAEISFLSFWWEKVDKNTKLLVRRFLTDGQLEIVTGGWVMNDEATAHYYAMIEQMVEGHQWLEHNLDYKPKNGWAIDPFGLSPTMAYLLRRMGLDNMVIQRVHYSIKKYLAQQKSLEFLWRQPWDHNHTMDILCHTMPFYSYDIPHTCGPDPKVCCQFDFKRLPGNKVNCPWRVPPIAINDKNIADRAWLLLDQYRKKAQLFRANVVMVQLGDDFRYDKATEWDQQFNNYQKLFDYINSREDWHAEAQFGTLEDYFTALREDIGVDSRNMPANFPSLIGDFFTYADRDDHYWSGFYTSRPFYKNMDRILEAHLRGAEILFSLMWAKMGNIGTSYLPFIEGLMKDLVSSRRALGLFQHHDAITGTSKDHVVIDYATRMFHSIQKLRNVISQSAMYVLLLENEESIVDAQMSLLQLDEYRQQYSSLPTKIPIKFSVEKNVRHVILYNSLSHFRKEIVTLRIAAPSVEVKDSTGKLIPCQINPVFSKASLVKTEFELAFIAEIPALGLITYFIHLIESEDAVQSRASITFFNVDNLPDTQDFVMRHFAPPEEFAIKSNYLTAVFSGTDGMLRRISSSDDGITVDARVQFLKYGTRTKGKDKSGAYLFLPDSEAQEVKYSKPHIRVIEGALMSEVTVFLPEVEHRIRLKNSPGLDGSGFEIYNLVDMTQDINKELIMRFVTNISNENQDFYTDLNGLQTIKRHIFEKLPLQANVYPVTSMIYFEDSSTRFSLLTGHSTGATSLKPGWLEVFLDRRLNQDDNRGLQQGITDNKQTPLTFRILLEHSTRTYPHTASASSYPSLLAHHASLSLLHPVFPLVKLEPLLEPNLNIHGTDVSLQLTYSPVGTELPCDVHLLNLRTLQAYPGGSTSYLPANSSALFLHRLGFDCNYRMWGISCSTRNGTVSVGELFPDNFGPTVEEASLSLMYTGSKFSRDAHIQLPPMEIVTLRLSRR